MPPSVTITDAQPRHATAIAEIYNQGISTQIATFETRPRSGDDVAEWLTDDIPIKIVVIDEILAGFARVSSYRDRQCYAGIKEYSIYVDNKYHRQGIGQLLMQALINDCRERGIWKLLSRIFPENVASMNWQKASGFVSLAPITSTANWMATGKTVLLSN